ncbi:hypothetical protein A3D80_03485 [Candidatus Roizmanbacteria bacterium RIFCSPHIGHO2_02_FULL_40_13b]|uniref:Antitoxin n=1 Tax=Candidatus Roizmanbacteria bacterium RIFCSPHIGHO2_01_FULL_39_24 TaxID=1802032 RepID=A0A1F7GJI7_9BACT|nr:MAG: hypothetical protein A2799_04330 [Candidatus Roizmanbacteria bacterium RIFCSPHIGHO2_01_FULL_39_24]OGK27029.1 MAG: hypothetical protein A3D80_03485 [Candidatus Roizmanbacteria bacterium RIFCSPHIGHO2_02_FULL_40_13b]OGK48816.1 MAG: hypothetical protein A3A56_01240 [Candidatus Roizmanbacteria bacterium RIFCSPLOWO2_01_FULL_40_32]OGK57296.1 MAG: hypothetical protein A3H83_00150 [Candidatus Roizmanbacteria bacterium RIFCSPLOWO2_02_FULL_39_8]
MNTKTTIPITEARKNIFDIAEAVQQPGVHYTFTEKGRPKAVLISAEEFESWQETFEVMEQFPDLSKDIEEAHKAFESGEYKNWVTLDALLKQEGFLVSDKVAKKYGIPSKTKTNSRKKT